MKKKQQIYLKTSSTATLLLALTGPVLAFGSRAMPILIILIGLVAFFEIKKTGNRVLTRSNSASSLFAPFFIYICLSALWSPMETEAFIQIIQFLSLLIPIIFIMRYWQLLETLSAEKTMRVVWQSLLVCLIILVMEMFTEQSLHRWINQIVEVNTAIGTVGAEIDKSILNRPIAAMSMLIFAMMVPFGRSRGIGLASLVILGFIALWFYQSFYK